MNISCENSDPVNIGSELQPDFAYHLQNCTTTENATGTLAITDQGFTYGEIVNSILLLIIVVLGIYIAFFRD